jgi:hypothetical protein
MQSKRFLAEIKFAETQHTPVCAVLVGGDDIPDEYKGHYSDMRNATSLEIEDTVEAVSEFLDDPFGVLDDEDDDDLFGETPSSKASARRPKKASPRVSRR